MNIMKNRVWLTFDLPYEEYLGMGNFAHKYQRFAIEMMGEHFAKASWINNFALDTNINHCGRFKKDVIILDKDGFIVKNEHLLKCRSLITFHQTLMAGIQMGKERLTA